MSGNTSPVAMRASDADRDAVVSDLSEHFQAGRLTVEEFDERTTQALAARTWGELRELTADLPASPAAAGRPAGGQPGPQPRHPMLPMGALAPIAVIAAVLFVVGHAWGLIWLLVPVLLIARGLTGHRRCGQQD